MKNRFFCALVLAFFMSLSPLALAGEVVGKFSGYGTEETAEFEVSAPWVLDWVVNGDYPHMMAIEVSLIDAQTGGHSGYVLKTKNVGNGVRLFNEAGRYRLRIDSAMMRWTFKIEQLSREEAELYKPIEKESM